MTLSLEAEALAKEALKAADDARRAQQRLQMLKKRYGMTKAAAKKAASESASTQATTPVKTVIEPVSAPSKTVIDHTPPVKVEVDVHKDREEDASMDHTTVETRGTSSAYDDEATSKKTNVADALAALGPPPPPPPAVIRAPSPKKAEESTPMVVEAVSPNMRDESAAPQVEAREDEAKDLSKPSEAPATIESNFDSEKREPDVVHSDVQANEDRTTVAREEPENATVPHTKEDDGSVGAPVPELSKQQDEEDAEEKPEAERGQNSPSVVEENDVVTEDSAQVTEEKEPEETAVPQESEGEIQYSKPEVFSFPDNVEKEEEAGDLMPEENFEPLQQQTRSPLLPVLEEASEESLNSSKEEAEQQVPEPAPIAKEPKGHVSSRMVRKMREQAVDQEGYESFNQDRRHRREANGSRADSFKLPKPAFLEAQEMMDAMLAQPVGKAIPEMAVSTPPVSQYYAASETLQPIDELQQRIAAIPETKDDVPAPHVHDNFGPYHFGDDVSVLTDFGPKPMSPRNFRREAIPEESSVLGDDENSRQPNKGEESSLYGDAPGRGERQKSNFVSADTPRFRNTGGLSPRSVDPEAQQDPAQNDPRQPQSQDPPQINTRQFDHGTGRGMEAPEVKVQPLVKHLRGRVEPEARPSRRAQLTINPYSPRQVEAPEAISPLSASGQSTARPYPQNRAAGQFGYNNYPGSPHSTPLVVSNLPPVQHRYITTRSGAASVAGYHRQYYPSDAASVVSHQPMGYYHRGGGGSPAAAAPHHFGSGGSVASVPYQRNQFFGSGGSVAFHEQHYVPPSAGASVAPSVGGATIISVHTNARGRKVVKKLVKVEETEESDPVVAFCDLINIDKVCGIEFDEQYKVVEEELPPEPLSAADVARNAAMGKKVFNENNYTDPFAGRHDDSGLCGLL